MCLCACEINGKDGVKSDCAGYKCVRLSFGLWFLVHTASSSGSNRSWFVLSGAPSKSQSARHSGAESSQVWLMAGRDG